MNTSDTNITADASAYPLRGNEIELTPAMAHAWAMAGIERLDAHFGDYGWRQSIALSMLDMASGGNCVLGQLFGEFILAPYALRETGYFGGLATLRTLRVGSLDRGMTEYGERVQLLHSILTDAYAAALAPLATATESHAGYDSDGDVTQDVRPTV